VDGQQDPTFLDPAFVALGFILWDTDADECSSKTANRTANADPG
jgi:hypothetical protein